MWRGKITVHEKKWRGKFFWDRYKDVQVEATLNLIKNTVHSSKGKEADYVVVLELQSGKHGFPSEKTTNPLLDALLPTPEDFEFAEERRLFYVAITRAKKRSYLIADMTKSSVFIKELLNKDDYDIELNEFDITQDQKITQNFYCIKCETGIMQPKVNQKNKSTFYGCSHYSLCKHTENGCVECGEQHNPERFARKSFG